MCCSWTHLFVMFLILVHVPYSIPGVPGSYAYVLRSSRAAEPGMQPEQAKQKRTIGDGAKQQGHPAIDTTRRLNKPTPHSHLAQFQTAPFSLDAC